MISDEIKIFFPDNSDFAPDKIDNLHELINRVYIEAESGLFFPGMERITLERLEQLFKTKTLLLAEYANKLVGCVHIEIIDKNTAQFGMLVADSNYRGMGIGRMLVAFSEQWAIDNGCSLMCLELLTPKDWKQPHKEFLKAWYIRRGYAAKFTKLFEGKDLLATPCDFTVYQKHLK